MIIPIPAIDLKDGRVVRLLQGRFDEEKVYAEDPKPLARAFMNDGAQRLHVVDLDGAVKGEPKNQALIERILESVSIPVEVGGGIRSLEQAERYLKLGVHWVIFGTKACLDEGFLKEALDEFGDRAIIGIDAKDGLVAVDGWTKVLSKRAVDLAGTIERCGGRTVIYTDISKDGVLAGPNLVQIAEMARSVKLDLIASGGVGEVEHLRQLGALGIPNVKGVIIGKALYEKKFTMKEALKACSPNA